MKFKKILFVFLWLVVIAMITTLLVYSNKDYQSLRCHRYDIKIDINGKDTLLFKKDINQIVKKCCDSLIGKRYSRINMERIEKSLNDNKYVKEAEVYSDLSGNITLHVVQHVPVLRIITNENASYFLDLEGNKIDIDRPAHVLIAHGFFNSDTSFQEVLSLFKCIQHDDLLRVQIGEIYRSENGIYQLSPVVGSHEIVLGRADNFEEGLSKLKLFYENEMDDLAWKEYKKIDLRFRDQVVCSKSK